MKDAKLTPRITETAKGLWTVYCALSVACVLGYWLGGMSALDAWAHMFTTMSLGGLSTHDSSFGFFQSPTLEWVALSSCWWPAATLRCISWPSPSDSLPASGRDAEWRGTMGLLLGASVFVAGLLLVKGTMTDPLETLRVALFNVISIGSTTGFATVDYTTWPVFAPLFMIMLSGVATSAGSTGAGIKMARVLILLSRPGGDVAHHPSARGVSGAPGRARRADRYLAVGAGHHAGVRRHDHRVDPCCCCSPTCRSTRHFRPWWPA